MGSEALHEAVRDGRKEAVNDLLERGVPINVGDVADGRTPLHIAAEVGNPEMMQLLCRKGADKDAFDNHAWTPLFLAIVNGQVEGALALLSAGADASLRCGEFMLSVAHVAAQEGYVGILRAALQRGAHTDTPDIYQMKALHYAANYNETEAIDVLLEAGAEIEARTQELITPLHCAAGMLNLEAVTTLVKHGANCNAQDDDVRTPLHYAVRKAGKQGASEVVDLLLRSGADETRRDDGGSRAADVVADRVGWILRMDPDVDRVRRLLASAPADRAWRRRGYLLLCRAHPDRVRKMPELAKQVGGEWEAVMAKVVELQEEGIFRTIVGYL